MLDDSPGIIAQKLNELAGLDIIDRMFKNINSFILHDKREIDRCAADIKQKEGELKSLDYIDEAKKEVQQCQELAAQAESFLEINDEMIEIEKNLRFYDNEIDKAQKVVALEKDVNFIKEKINTYNDLNAKLDEMSKLNSLLVSILNEIEDETEWIQVEGPFNEIQKMITSLKQKEENLLTKERQLQTLSSLDNNISRESQKLESSKEKYKEILLRMKICPVCKGKVDTKCINKIMGEL